MDAVEIGQKLPPVIPTEKIDNEDTLKLAMSRRKLMTRLLKILEMPKIEEN